MPRHIAEGSTALSGAMEFIGEYTPAIPGTSTSIDISNIPQRFRDLRLVIVGQSQRSGFAETGLRMRMNGFTSGYSTSYNGWYNGTEGQGSSDSQTSWYLGNMPAGNRSNDNYVTAHTVDIPHYSRTDIIKSIYAEFVGNATSTHELTGTARGSYVGGTNAITSLSILDDVSGALGPRARVLLYGIRDSVPAPSAPSEVYNLTNATTYDITGLDGNTEGPYRLIIEGNWSASGSDKSIFVRPNNDSGGSNYVALEHGANHESGVSVSTVGPSAALVSGLRVGANSWSDSGPIVVDTVIQARSGIRRTAISRMAFARAANNSNIHRTFASTWVNTTDNITSLRIDFGAAFTGTVRIEKLGVQSSVAVPLVQRVTSLPVNPYHGQEIDFVADATNGVVWRLRYNSTSASAYKWEAVGSGAPLRDYGTYEQTNSSTYSAGTDVVQVTTPLAGDWEVAFGASLRNDANGGQALVSVAIGGTAPVDGDAIVAPFLAAQGISASVLWRYTGVAASTVIQMRHRRETTGYAIVERRWMAVRPIRVG